MWLALSLQEESKIKVFRKSVSLQVSDMADGCIGFLLAFGTKEEAAKYVGDGGKIIELGEVTK